MSYEITGDSLADRAAELLLQGRKVNPDGLRLLAQKYTAIRAQLSEAQARLALRDELAVVLRKCTRDGILGPTLDREVADVLAKVEASPVSTAAQEVAGDVVTLSISALRSLTFSMDGRARLEALLAAAQQQKEGE